MTIVFENRPFLEVVFFLTASVNKMTVSVNRFHDAIFFVHRQIK